MAGYPEKPLPMLGKLRVKLGQATPGEHENLLAQVQYRAPELVPSVPRCWSLGLPSLNPQAQPERWLVDSAVDDVVLDGFAGSNSTDWAWIGQQQPVADDEDICALTRQLFLQLHAASQALNKPHVARLWIIIPQIHIGQGDQERYKRFCSGRHQAYSQLGIHAPHFPAATVIGCAHGPLRMHALLCSQAGQAVENPQQTSAYKYPRNYGPDSPSFSRALQLGPHFFVSGTAAIKGAHSQHDGDTTAQLDAIDANLRILCEQQGTRTPWHDQARYGRIYLRDANEAAQLIQHLQQLWPNAIHWPVLQADICREELLCEVETSL